MSMERFQSIPNNQETRLIQSQPMARERQVQPPKSLHDTVYFRYAIEGKKYKIKRELIDKIVTLPPTDSAYPLPEPFEEAYRDTRKKDFVADVAFRYTLVRALIDDGRYKNLKFLITHFIPNLKQIPEEAEALRGDLQQRAEKVLQQRKIDKDKKNKISPEEAEEMLHVLFEDKGEAQQG